MKQSLMRVGRIVGRIVGVLLLAVLLYLVLAPTGRYLVRAAWEEARILAHRRPITDIVDDSATSAAVRQKLRVVLAARAFARSEEHTSELQSRQYLVCRLLLEKKKQKNRNAT